MALEAISFGGFKGHVARPKNATGLVPGVLVLPDAGGAQPFLIDRAEALAQMGYIAVAGDYYGDGWGGGPPQSSERVGVLMGDLSTLHANVHANMDALKALEGVDPARTAAIGFCMGGAAVIELARSGYDCAAIVSFHGLLQTTQPAQAGKVKARMLVCTGADDPLVPMDKVTAFQAEMDAAQTDCQTIIYTGAAHSFMKPAADGTRPGIIYHAPSAKRGWRAMAAHLEEAFA